MSFPQWALAGGRRIRLDGPRLMGVLNVTPDSFSDGGAWADAAAAAGHGEAMLADGADLIDVGGESTRPGADRVPAAEQIRRVVPVIEALVAATGAAVSIDTTSAEVAAAALDAGAVAINDVSAGRDDPRLLDLAATRCCGLVLMHRRIPPRDDAYSDRYETPPAYDDVVATVKAFLLERAAAAEATGVDRAAIVIDPGLGFGKSVQQNFELIRRSGELVATGYPVLSAASRKSFIGAAGNVTEPARRVQGSTAVSVLHWCRGVRLFRVHDVAAHRQALAVAAAVEAQVGAPRPDC